MHSQSAVQISRPKTAATTNSFDESRIKQKLQFLEDLESKLEEDIANIQDATPEKKSDKGLRLNREMVLDAAMCDELPEV